MATFASDREARDWLRQMALEFGLEELYDLGLSYTDGDESVLIAMNDVNAPGNNFRPIHGK